MKRTGLKELFENLGCTLEYAGFKKIAIPRFFLLAKMLVQLVWGRWSLRRSPGDCNTQPELRINDSMSSEHLDCLKVYDSKISGKSSSLPLPPPRHPHTTTPIPTPRPPQHTQPKFVH